MGAARSALQFGEDETTLLRCASETKAEGSQERELCRKEMVTNPGLVGNAGKRFSGRSKLEKRERPWKQEIKHDQCWVPEKKSQDLAVDG